MIEIREKTSKNGKDFAKECLVSYNNYGDNNGKKEKIKRCRNKKFYL